MRLAEVYEESVYKSSKILELFLWFPIPNWSLIVSNIYEADCLPFPIHSLLFHGSSLSILLFDVYNIYVRPLLLSSSFEGKSDPGTIWSMAQFSKSWEGGWRNSFSFIQSKLFVFYSNALIFFTMSRYDLMAGESGCSTNIFVPKSQLFASMSIKKTNLF